MKTTSRLIFAAALALAGLMSFTAAMAQDAVDPPARVARLAYLSGDVQFFSEDTPDWAAAYLNQPITSRNSLYTGARSRAEVRFGASAVSLDENTQLDIQQLDDVSFSASVVRGSASIRVRRIDADESYILTAASGSFTLVRPGRYRIDAAPDGSRSSVAVLSGRVDAEAGGGTIPVEAGRSLTLTAGNDGQAGVNFGRAASTEFDAWTLARDDSFRDGESVRYVSPNMTGYEELDANGRWQNDPTYGNVWIPTTYVRDDWVPYRYGRWSYVAPWGWTWIDDAPWGFAPFHYGRWVTIGSGWGWVPGAYVARPAYAPALVGFYGGSGFNVSVTVGGGPSVGWYPLAPWERYSPRYSRNNTYISRVNNITIVNPPPRGMTRYNNQAISNNQMRGATVVEQNDFARSRPIGRAFVPMSQQNVVERFGRGEASSAPPIARPQPAGNAQGGRPGGGRPEFEGRGEGRGDGRGDPRGREFGRPVQPNAQQGGQAGVQAAPQPNQPSNYSRPAPGMPLGPNQPAPRFEGGQPQAVPAPQNFPAQRQNLPETVNPSAQPNRAPVSPAAPGFVPRGQPERDNGDVQNLRQPRNFQQQQPQIQQQIQPQVQPQQFQQRQERIQPVQPQIQQAPPQPVQQVPQQQIQQVPRPAVPQPQVQPQPQAQPVRPAAPQAQPQREPGREREREPRNPNDPQRQDR